MPTKTKVKSYPPGSCLSFSIALGTIDVGCFSYAFPAPAVSRIKRNIKSFNFEVISYHC